jgi:uncharacterized protein (UPF0276 family)
MGTVGVGLRTPHYNTWLSGVARRPPFVEAITENVLARGGRPKALLERVRSDGDVFLHGVSLSIGSVDPIDGDYLTALEELVARVDPRFVSDHLCFGRVGGVTGHDLWPLPLTEETLAHVSTRVRQVQDRLERKIALENVSSYVRCRADTLSEARFLAELAERADCLLLIDINNIVVSAHNHGFDARKYLETISPERVAYLHVAGHTKRDGYRFDDHASVPDDEVIARLGDAFRLFGDVPCIFEWDENYPDLTGYLEMASRIERDARSSREARSL